MQKEIIIFDGEFYDTDGNQSTIKSSGTIDKENFESIDNFFYVAFIVLLTTLVDLIFVYSFLV